MKYELKGRLYSDDLVTVLPEFAKLITEHEWILITGAPNDSTLFQKKR